jgi:hypothetical protein
MPSQWPVARGVMRDEEDLLKPQLGDDGIHVPQDGMSPNPGFPK